VYGTPVELLTVAGNEAYGAVRAYL